MSESNGTIDQPTDDCIAAATARAFNAGSDARIAGHRIDANPHKPGTVGHAAWLRGWRHVHGKWGTWQVGRHFVAPLPPVERKKAS